MCILLCALGAVGELGGARDPDVVASVLLQHMAMGARGSMHPQECLGTIFMCGPE